ncbi:response regulator [Sphingomonas panacisoli]|uniref:Response regulator n=1 Tax=Sphingomonas panacisoli TaxID=1813879 RepID=A0A5B8LJI0_9SPHN|nr:response regulator [Sphingomonas panacisoli]QDZ08261.1 response regulator [Sphingomonas panacisoli]
MTGPLKLLYVDDDRDIRTIVEMALSLDPTIDVRTAISGQEAVAFAATTDWRPDVLVLDIMMPGMDGLATLRALRELPGLGATPALFITAKARDADIARYRDEGAAGVILKPFDPLQLATEIRTLIARP